jgi:hypothetical protein
MAAKDRTTWGEVCSKVSWGEGLYSTCRKQVEGYTGFGNDEEIPEEAQDFTKVLKKHALPVPPPPKLEDIDEETLGEAEENDLFSKLRTLATPRNVAIGVGVLSVIVWWLGRNKQVAAVTDAPASQPAAPAPQPTRIQIPDSIRVA